ncbi:DNA-binding protein [Paludibacterium yongneupense]|uniref:DNA-binding protein n=1 Tax=Paludibacterium yongneupense TaxID=400061 RepID=UPI0003F9541F|nr:DNA-binding protein [Paludibacterium yongneupense]
MASDIYAKIRQAAFELVSEGVWPTVVEVRSRLGTGSNTTINTTLKEWRTEFLSRMAVSSRRPDWPEGLAGLFEQLWQRACDAADSQLETVRSEVRDEALELRLHVAALQERVDAQEADLQRNAADSERAAQRERQLEQALAQQQARSLAAETRQDELAQALDAARLEIRDRRVEFESRMSEVEARADERVAVERDEAARRETLAYERLEGLRVHLYAQVEDERRALQLERKRLEDDLGSARAELVRQDSAWRERSGERERELGRLSARLDGFEQRVSELQSELALERAAALAAGERLLVASSDLARREAEDHARAEGWLRVLRDERARWTALAPSELDDWLRKRLEA